MLSFIFAEKTYRKCLRIIPRVSKLMTPKFAPVVTLQKLLKTELQKQKSNNIFVKIVTVDFYTYKAYQPQLDEKIIAFTKEGLGIRSTARILKISTTTLLKKLISIASNIKQPIIPKGKTYEVDEIRFFIRNKINTMWLVYALDTITKEVSNFFIGKRNNKTLNVVVKTLLNSKAEKIFTNKLKNYQYLIP